MRRLIIYSIILLVSIWFGVKIAQDPGYLLLAYKRWTVEMPLWFGFVSLIVLFFLLYTLLRFWRNLRTLPARWQYRKQKRYKKKLDKLSQQAFLAFAGGDWNRAQKSLSKASAYTQLSWLYNLGAAFSAHELSHFDQRDAYLKKVSETSSEAKLAVNLLKAKFDYEKRPLEAVTLLESVRQQAPKQPYTLRLLAQNYEKLQDWNNLLELLPSLRKYKVFSASEIDDLEIKIYRGLLHNAEYSNAASLQLIWKNASRHARNNPQFIKSYISLLIAKGAYREAEEQLRESLKQVWDDELVELYGHILTPKPEQQLSYAEKWLPQHKTDATLLFVLGNLSVQNQLWGKARSYFEASLAVEPRQQTYLALGQLLEKLGENKETIINCFKSGLRLKKPVEA